jgi:hypothetical protein
VKIFLYIIAVIVGCIAMGATVWAVESVGHLVYPPPAEMQTAMQRMVQAAGAGEVAEYTKARDEVGVMVTALPVGALLVIVLGWTLAAVVGGGLAALIAPVARLTAALAVTGFDLLAISVNLVMIPHPVWMAPVGLIATAGAGIWVGLCVRRWRASQAVGHAVSPRS